MRTLGEEWGRKGKTTKGGESVRCSTHLNGNVFKKPNTLIRAKSKENGYIIRAQSLSSVLSSKLKNMNRNYNVKLSTDDLLRKSRKKVNCNPFSQGRSKHHNWFIWLVIWSALGYSKMKLKLKIWTAVEHLPFFLIKSKHFISIVMKFLW